jgi:thiol:disulfide interchange protein DsbC
MIKKNKSILLATLLTSLIASSAFADEASLRKAIETTYPQVKVDSITKTPFAGMYEVFAGGQILYADDKLTYLITDGQLIDPKTKRNITSSRLEELTKVDVSTLPLDQAIKVVKGNGSRKLFVFSDPDCPYCKRLEQNELINITDVTIYTFLYPLEQLHPDAGNKARAIWCAPDKATAWQDWIDNGQLPKTTATCDTPIDKIADLGKKYNITSTPTLIFADGKRMLGAYPAKDIEKGMGSGQVNKLPTK